MTCLFRDRAVHKPALFLSTLSKKYVLLLLLILITTSAHLTAPRKAGGVLLSNSPVTLTNNRPGVQNVATDSLPESALGRQGQSTAPLVSGTEQTKTILRFKWALTATVLLLLLAIGIIIYSRRQVYLRTTALQNLLNQEKKLRHSLQNSEEKFRSLFHTSPDSITLSSLDGNYVEVNKGFCKAIGYSPEEVLGKNPSELHIWRDMAARKRLLTTLERTGHVENIEAQFRCKNGSTVTGLISATIMEIDGVPHILAITRDISTYKKQQKKLRKAEQRWRNTFDAIGDCIIVWDADMHILQANRAARKFFNSENPDDGQYSSALRGQSKDKPDSPVAKTFLDGQPHCAVVKDKKSNTTFMATSHPVFSHGNTVTQVVQIARDITKDLALEQKRILLITAIEQSSETIIITDLDGNIQYANPAFERHTGFSRAEVLGKNPHILKSGKHNQSFYHQLWSIILSGRTWQGKFINRKKTGELFEEEATISPVTDADGKLINFIAVKRDITHERVLEQQLQQAQKLEAIGTLAGGIAHDFNNILGAILGFAEMARLEIPVTCSAREDVEEIIVAGQRAVELVKQILTFSRQGKETFQTIRIQPLLKETFKLLKASLPSTIQLKQHIDASCKPILGDPTRLQQVILNICTNAKHAIGEQQGEISISLHQKTIDTAKAGEFPPLPSDGPYLELKITDNGCGMDQQTKDRIFDPFFTTKPKQQGTGLGLSVTHGIIRQHGGKINVISSPGEGTTFYIHLPTTEDRPEELSELIVDPFPRGSEHIVLVDDEKLLVELTERMLTILGYTVTPFSDSQLALAWMQDNITGFDLLISDITMPKYTGMVLTEKLLALRPELPIILCTGFSEKINKEQAAAQGIRTYLMKPVDMQQLAQTLYQVLHHDQHSPR